MQMELYWPQHKVFFYGQLALFSERLEGRPLSKDELARYFPAYSSTEELLASLREYEQAGYFKVEVMLDSSYLEWERNQAIMASRAEPLYSDPYYPPDLGEVRAKVVEQSPLAEKDVSHLLKPVLKGKTEQHLRFKLNDIDKHKFYDELEAYLDKYRDNKLTTGETTKPENFANQRGRLIRAAAEDYAQHEYVPVIARPAIWQNKPTHDTFWELVLAHQIVAGDIWIVNIGYNDTKGQRLAHGISSVSRAGTVPFAEFRIESDEFKRAVLPHKIAKADHKLGSLVVTEDNRVMLDGKDLGLRAQLRYLCRLLVAKSPDVVLLDELEHNADIIDPNKQLKNPRQNIQKYVSELRAVLGNEFVIRNDEQEGYRLLLRSDVKSE